MKALHVRKKTLLLALVGALALATCGDDDGDDGGGNGGQLEGKTLVAASMTGEQEVPRAQTSASGRGRVIVANDGSRLQVNLAAQGFATAVSAAHIHLGQPGEAGPVLVPLFDRAADGDFPAELEREITADGFAPMPELGVSSFSELLDAVREGRTYLNVHTEQFPNGEVRGHVGAATLAVTMSTEQEVPATNTGASGNGVVTLAEDQGGLGVSFAAQGFGSAVTAAHIHVGRPGENGPVLFTLFEAQQDGELGPQLQRELGAEDLQARPELGIVDFDDFLTALLGGRTYLNVHTEQNPDGELRGHVGPAVFSTALTGSQEVPPVATQASGTSRAHLRADQQALTVLLEATGFSTEVVAAHVHLGAPGANGVVIFPLFDAAAGDAFASPLTLVLTSAELQPVAGAMTFEEAARAVLTGRTYVNVHTSANPQGEVRGQLGAAPAPTPPDDGEPPTPSPPAPGDGEEPPPSPY